MSNISISTALSGLNAASTAISVVGNNLANLNTTGYKNVAVSFEDMVSQYTYGSPNKQVGLGVNTPNTTSQFSQGALQGSSGPFDAAINGNGFFVVKDPATNQTLLTRDGSFQSDLKGNLVTANGLAVQGWQAAADGTINAGGPVTGLTVPVGGTYPPVPTTSFSLAANLNAAAAAGSTFTQQIQAVDSLGNSVPLTVTFSPATPAVAGSWTYTVTMPAALGSAGGTTPVSVGTGALAFDANGNLTTPAPGGPPPVPIALTIPTLADGATIGSPAGTINWSVYNPDGTTKLTQFAAPSAASVNTQDGQPASELTGVGIGADGKIQATYSNGLQKLVGQLALGSVQNPQSLLSVSNNNFALSGGSSALTIGESGTGGRGLIQGQSLESSTVDVATQFSNLLVFQRSYQANSRVITASDELVQDTMALIK